MARPKKNLDLDKEFDDTMSMGLSSEPIPVKVVQEKYVNPDIGKIPFEGDPRPSRRYLFQYNQQPGTNLEFTRGLLCLNKGTGRRKNEFFSYDLQDGEVYELPEEIANHLMKLTYYEDGRSRTRCTLIPQ